ncbi:MAG TPA: hypothetical protein VFO89_06870 [Thermoanaerobaculia bacterium]|nr:hypothetical protein [Thermoanaerobaculia bacterium]
MRVWSRIALVAVALLAASTVFADHFIAECPLTLVDSTPAVTEYELSPRGVFRSGSLVYVLRGNVLTTYTTNDVGNLQVAREDFVASMAARETEGGAAFSAGYLFLSSEAGLEIFDLRNTRAGGTAPVLVSRTPGLHYRRLAVNANRLAGLFPSTDLPCYPDGTAYCFNRIDLYDITSLTAPAFRSTILSTANTFYRGWNDIAFNFGYLLAVSENSLNAFDLTNLSLPRHIAVTPYPGKWLVSNGGDYVAVGRDATIDSFTVRPGLSPFFVRNKHLALPYYLTIERGNGIRFNRNGFWDDTTGRLFTMIDEIDPMTLRSARTIAFDVFDYTVQQYEGDVERIYEEVTLLTDDERKHNPTVVGPFVYVIGEETGLQSYGACGNVTGRIELESPFYLTCNGAEIHGWVTGTQKIVNVEVFLGNTPLGAATLGQHRTDVSATTPVRTWRINVNLDNTARGEYQLRAIGTDILGVRRQFAMKRLFFPGPGQNCTTPRRRAAGS